VCGVLFTRDPRQSIARSSSFSGEGESLTDRQLGKMNIDFGLIDAFSSKVLMHGLLWNPLVDLTLHGFHEQCNLP
jgi:hypothetical protein